MSEFPKTPIGLYMEWLMDMTQEVRLPSEWIEISTPFMGVRNDGLCVFVREEEDETVTIADGEYVSSLFEDFSFTEEQVEKAKQILTMHDMKMNDDGEVQVRCPFNYYPVTMHLFLRGLMILSNFAEIETQPGNT